MVLQLYIPLQYIYIYIYYIYIFGYNVFHRPHPGFQVFYMCTFQKCCARVRDVVHVSQQLCTFHRSCARTSPLITFVFNCLHTERIQISKSIGATNHVLPIYIYIYIYNIYIYIYLHTRWSGRYIRVCKFLGKTICVCVGLPLVGQHIVQKLSYAVTSCFVQALPGPRWLTYCIILYMFLELQNNVTNFAKRFPANSVNEFCLEVGMSVTCKCRFVRELGISVHYHFIRNQQKHGYNML